MVNLPVELRIRVAAGTLRHPVPPVRPLQQTREPPVIGYGERIAAGLLGYRTKKGRYVALVGNLRISQNEKDDKVYTNLDVWVQSLDAPQLSSGE